MTEEHNHETTEKHEDHCEACRRIKEARENPGRRFSYYTSSRRVRRGLKKKAKKRGKGFNKSGQKREPN